MTPKEIEAYRLWAMDNPYTKQQKFRNALEERNHPYNWPDDHWYFDNNATSRALKKEYASLTEAQWEAIMDETVYPPW